MPCAHCSRGMLCGMHLFWHLLGIAPHAAMLSFEFGNPATHLRAVVGASRGGQKASL